MNIIKEYTIYILVLVCANHNGFAQTNLVPNPSFENFSICPTAPNTIYYAVPWFQPYAGNANVTASSSSDYYNVCDSNSASGVPYNFIGFQNARTGLGYAGFATLFNPDTSLINYGYREYIEVQLDSPLIAGNGYCLQYYVSLAESATIATNHIDAYFSNDSLIDSRTTSSYQFIPVQPQIIETTVITDTSEEWVLISGFYIAQGGERFLTIGNFYDDANTLYIHTFRGNEPGAYYYIDDVSLKWCSGVGINESRRVNNYVNVYPSPNDGKFTLSYHLSSSDNELQLMDFTGRKVYYQTLNNNDGRVSIDVDLSNGIYYWEVVSENGIEGKGRIAIIK